MQVLDEAGDVVVSKIMDGCPRKGIPDFAYAKAYTCIVTKNGSRQFRDKYTAASDPVKF